LQASIDTGQGRVPAIAVFYGAGTAIGGIVAPWHFGTPIGTASRWNVFFGYCGAALLMLAMTVMELRFGVDAEDRALEQIVDSPIWLPNRFSAQFHPDGPA
jgi:hypothetical protein